MSVLSIPRTEITLTTVEVTITQGSRRLFETATFANSSANVTFNSVPTGTWSIKGVVKGSGNFDVYSGTTTGRLMVCSLGKAHST